MQNKKRFYPKLFENPNAINVSKLTGLENDIVEWNDDNSSNNYVFSYHKGKLFILKGLVTHDNLPGYRGLCSGRLFTKYKVITFWKFPKDFEELIKVLQDIENETNMEIIEDPEWKIEIPVNDSEIDTTIGWGSWKPKETDIDYVPIQDYRKPQDRSEEELQMRHLNPPIAGKKPIVKGFVLILIDIEINVNGKLLH